MTSRLEEQYRRLLAWYPRSWRARHEDAFVGMLLDAADAERRTAPTLKERSAIAGHGLSARLDRVIAPSVRPAGSTVALTAGTGIAVTEFVVSSWVPSTLISDSPLRIGPFHDIGFVCAGLWVIALIAALTDRWVVGRVALVLSIIAVTSVPFSERLWPGFVSADRATLVLLASSALIALLGRPQRGPATGGAALGWALLATLADVSPSFRSGQWAVSRSL